MVFIRAHLLGLCTFLSEKTILPTPISLAALTQPGVHRPTGLRRGCQTRHMKTEGVGLVKLNFTVCTGDNKIDENFHCTADLKKNVQFVCERDEINGTRNPIHSSPVKLSNLVVHFNEIETRFGRLRGIALAARNKRTYYAYYGIPYAKAPVGKLRFEPPVAADPWNGTLDATTVRTVCPQILQYYATYAGVEDCLYVDVYTPKSAFPGSNFPVVFYIFGGQHRYGTTVRDGVSIFMGRDIIIVRVSHRLGALGFLSTADTVIPGNMGLKDQAMALRWTRENIYDFGGDPNRVTLHGHSSGAACAYLLTLSPLSRDYYDRAIFQSALGTTPLLFGDRASAKAMTRALAEKVNCSVRSHEDLKTCLQTKTPAELVTASKELSVWRSEPQRIFKPTIEDENVPGAFLLSHPLLTPYPSHTKPWIIGMTTGEGLDFIDGFGDNIHPLLGARVTLPIVGAYKWTVNLNHLNYIEKIARTHFIGDDPSNNLTGLVKMFNGIMNGMALLEAVQTYRGPKFVYLFDYKGMNKNAHEDIIGVKHALDLQLIFVRPFGKHLTHEDKMFGEEIITRWVNFYYSGNPNQPFTINTTTFAAWHPMSSPRVEYLCINRSGIMGRDYFVNEYSWWKKIPFFRPKITDL